MQKLSLSEISDLVYSAWWDQYPEMEAPFPVTVYDSYLIVSRGPGQLWRVDWSLDGDGMVQFAAESDWVAVEREYVAKGLSVSRFVKSIGEVDGGKVVGSYLLLWGDHTRKDLEEEYFHPGTNLMLDYYPQVPTFFHHGMDNTVGKSVIGKRLSATPDDIGVFVKTWLDIQAQYYQYIEPLLEAKSLYYSPASAPQMVVKGLGGRLEQWPIVEDTLTPIPVQYRLVGRPITELKAAYAQCGLTYQDLSGDARKAAPGGAGGSGLVAVEREQWNLIDQRLRRWNDEN